MGKSVLLQTRLDPAIKERAEKILTKLGITHSQVINKLYSFIVQEKDLPFPVKLPNASGRGSRISARKAIQDFYPDNLSYCYGCGRLNQHGLQIKSYWEGREAVCEYRPKPYHTAIPGYVYGGLIASLIDCHGTGTAAAAIYRRDGRSMDSQPPVRCVTASLRVDYLRPTPLNTSLKLRAKVLEIKGRKVLVNVSLAAQREVCARAEVIAVQVDEAWMKKYL